MNRTPQRKSKVKLACVPCRTGKRKCDGQQPCCRCKKTGKTCKYVSLDTTQTDLSNLATRRKYIKSFFEGVNPTTIIIQSTTNIDIYDRAASPAQLLQMNSILAFSTRAFGASPRIYKKFSQKALSLVEQLATNYTFETALGYNYLAYYFWGEDDKKSEYFRNLTISTCKKALQRPENKYANGDLIQLQLTSNLITNNFLSDFLDKQSITSLIPPEIWINDSTTVTTLMHYLHSRFISDELYHNAIHYDGYFSIDHITYIEHCALFSALEKDFRMTPAVKVGLKFLILALHFLAGQYSDAISCITEAIDTLDNNEYLVGIIGARYTVLLQVAFKVSIRLNEPALAERISRMQEKHSRIFPASNVYFREDRILLPVSIHTTNTQQNSNVVETTNTSMVFDNSNTITHLDCPSLQSFDPFGWDSKITLPYISKDNETQSRWDEAFR